MTFKKCSECNAPFECGGCDTQQCWCLSIPPIFPFSAELSQNNGLLSSNDCFCPDCLKAKYEQKISDPANKELLKKAEADFYINAQGYTVFTEAFHLKRGYCCKNSCKHCPY
jgi:hypothetical protein